MTNSFLMEVKKNNNKTSGTMDLSKSKFKHIIIKLSNSKTEDLKSSKRETTHRG